MMAILLIPILVIVIGLPAGIAWDINRYNERKDQYEEGSTVHVDRRAKDPCMNEPRPKCE